MHKPQATATQNYANSFAWYLDKNDANDNNWSSNGDNEKQAAKRMSKTKRRPTMNKNKMVNGKYARSRLNAFNMERTMQQDRSNRTKPAIDRKGKKKKQQTRHGKMRKE